MKKLLLSLFAASVFSVGAFAQTWSILLTDPASNSTITSGQSTTYTYYLKNVSGSTITSGTNYALGFGTINGSSYSPFGSQLIARTLSADLAAGDSIQGSQSLTLSMPAGTNNAQPLCIAVYAISGTSASFQLASCRSYNFYNTLTEIEKAATTVQVYPNPATDVVNFTIEYNKAKMVKITDITGREVTTANFDINAAQVNVSTFKAGIYLYQIMDVDGNVIKSGKINVNN